MSPAALPAEQAARELDPQSDLGRILFDPSAEATKEWIETLLTVPNERGQIVNFNLFPQQLLMLQEQTGRDITVKGRQTRASSLILARNLRRMTTGFGLNCLVMTQGDDTTEMFRARIKHHLRDLASKGLDYPLVADNKDEIVIGKSLQNRFIFASGEERVTGRSYTAQIAHLSEVAHWKPESAAALIGGITPAIPGPPDGWFDLESTPNGADGVFYEYAQDAWTNPDDPYQPWRTRFYPWWLEPRYRCGPTVDCDFQVTKDLYAELISTFAPDPKEERLMVEYELTKEQVLWRRWRKREMARSGLPFEQEYVESFDDCWLTGMENFYTAPDGADHLRYYREGCRDPVTHFDSLPYEQSNISFYGPNLSIWEFPDPKNMYVMYMDCAEGGAGKSHDYTACAVMNVRTLHHVATLRLRAPPMDCAAMACAVGMYYNKALLAGERGGFGMAALERIKELRYPNLYYHYDPLRPYKQPDPWIWPTHQNRDEILRVHREAVFEHSFVTQDRVVVSEMSTFDWSRLVRSTQRKAQARATRFDDMVIACAGVTYVALKIAPYYLVKAHTVDRARELIVGPNGIVNEVPMGQNGQGPVFR